MEEKDNVNNESNEIKEKEITGRPKREWKDGANFNLEGLMKGEDLISTVYFGKNSITFKSLSSDVIEKVGEKYDLIGFTANRRFNSEILARSIVSFNGKPLKGNTIEEKMETLRKMPDAIFDLLLLLHQEFRARIQKIVTEDTINVF